MHLNEQLESKWSIHGSEEGLCWRKWNNWHWVRSLRLTTLFSAQPLPCGGTGDKSLNFSSVASSSIARSYWDGFPSRAAYRNVSRTILQWNQSISEIVEFSENMFIWGNQRKSTVRKFKNLTISTRAGFFTFWWNVWIWGFLRIWRNF